MDGELFCEVIQGVETVTGVKAFLVLAVAAFHLAVMAGRIGQDKFVRTPNSEAVDSNRDGRSCLPVRKRFVNSGPLSVWTHSTRMPRRAYQRTSFLRKSAEEKADCSG